HTTFLDKYNQKKSLSRLCVFCSIISCANYGLMIINGFNNDGIKVSGISGRVSGGGDIGAYT
ncbi:TPA: hypothetical protein ACNRV4_002305, partial [Escherichia coli]